MNHENAKNREHEKKEPAKRRALFLFYNTSESKEKRLEADCDLVIGSGKGIRIIICVTCAVVPFTITILSVCRTNLVFYIVGQFVGQTKIEYVTNRIFPFGVLCIGHHVLSGTVQ